MLQLTAKESDYLVGKISAQCHGTLIAELARDLSIDRDRPLPWELALPNAPPVLREVLFHARNFSDLVYGASDPKAGAAGSLYRLTEDRRLNHRVTPITGVRAAECSALLRTFFAQRRAAKPRR